MRYEIDEATGLGSKVLLGCKNAIKFAVRSSTANRKLFAAAAETPADPEPMRR